MADLNRLFATLATTSAHHAQMTTTMPLAWQVRLGEMYDMLTQQHANTNQANEWYLQKTAKAKAFATNLNDIYGHPQELGHLQPTAVIKTAFFTANSSSVVYQPPAVIKHNKFTGNSVTQPVLHIVADEMDEAPEPVLDNVVPFDKYARRNAAA